MSQGDKINKWTSPWTSVGNLDGNGQGEYRTNADTMTLSDAGEVRTIFDDNYENLDPEKIVERRLLAEYDHVLGTHTADSGGQNHRRAAESGKQPDTVLLDINDEEGATLDSFKILDSFRIFDNLEDPGITELSREEESRKSRARALALARARMSTE